VRLISWNCASGFHRKIEALSALAPDVAVVQECADLSILARKVPGFAPTDAFWSGDNPNRGLAVFSFGPYRLKLATSKKVRITYALPVLVLGPSTFNLVALWSHYGRTPIRVAAIGPTLEAFRAYKSLLMRHPSIVAGDLNNNVRWDRPGKANNHANAVTTMDTLGLVSAYHTFHGLEHGAEKHPTLYWRDRTRTGPTFHIDYAFVPKRDVGLVQNVALGSYSKWVGRGLSDHVPVIVDFAPQFAASAPDPNRPES